MPRFFLLSDGFASILQPLALPEEPSIPEGLFIASPREDYTGVDSNTAVLQTFVKLRARPSRHEAAHLRRVPDPPQDVEPVDPMQMPEQRAVLADRLLPAAALHARRQIKQMLAVSPQNPP